VLLLATVSSPNLIVYLVIGLVVGFVAYRSSEAFKQRNHVTPWRIPSLVWGVIGFISLLLCAVLFLIARRTTKPAVPAVSVTSPTIQVPPGWYQDPQSRHDYRFWDGTQWTMRVEDGGIEQVAEI
jgi:amino acid transporter